MALLALKGLPTLALAFIGYFVSHSQSAQRSKPAESQSTQKSCVGMYAGILEGNINYERALWSFPKSTISFRFGIGYASSLAFEGGYINPTLVYILGRKNSHFEANLGAKVFPFGSQQSDSPDAGFALPDVYAGYRYAAPGRSIYYRVGASVTTLLNVGIGTNF